MKIFLSCGSVCVEVRWSWAIAREWDDKSWQWRNNNNTDHHSHHLILQILDYDSHHDNNGQLMEGQLDIIIMSLSSSYYTDN